MSGQVGQATRAWSGLFAPASDISGVHPIAANISGLSDSDLNGVDAALGNALSQNYDEAMYETQVAVLTEETKRKKKSFVPCGAGEAQRCTPDVTAPGGPMVKRGGWMVSSRYVCVIARGEKC